MQWYEVAGLRCLQALYREEGAREMVIKMQRANGVAEKGKYQ